MPDQATTSLEEPLLETRQRPALNSQRQDQSAQELVLDEFREEIDGGQLGGVGLKEPRLEAGGHAGAAELAEGARTSTREVLPP